MNFLDLEGLARYHDNMKSYIATLLSGGISADYDLAAGYVAFSFGLKVCWGTGTFSGTDGTTVGFPVTFSAVPVVVATPFGGDEWPTLLVKDTTTTGFSVISASSGITCNWLAIGY